VTPGLTVASAERLTDQLTSIVEGPAAAVTTSRPAGASPCLE